MTGTLRVRALAVALALCAPAGLTGCVFVNADLLPPRGPAVEKVVVPAKSWLTSEKIAIVPISGVIAMADDPWFDGSKNTVDRLRATLNLIAKDREVVAVILRIDSPGGGVTASDLCHHELVRFKEETARQRGRAVPVVAALMDTAASGAYYVALSADEIWALPTSVTGSIGVVTTLPQLSGLADKLGVGMRVIKSGDKKDIGSMWREMSAEERAILQGLIDSLYAQFVKTIAANRKGLTEESARALGDGRVFTAEQALEKGLIDKIGYLDQAVDAAKARAGVKDAAVVIYAPRGQTKDSLYASQTALAPATAALPSGSAPRINVLNIEAAGALGLDGPRFHYLWLP